MEKICCDYHVKTPLPHRLFSMFCFRIITNEDCLSFINLTSFKQCRLVYITIILFCPFIKNNVHSSSKNSIPECCKERHIGKLFPISSSGDLATRRRQMRPKMICKQNWFNIIIILFLSFDQSYPVLQIRLFIKW